MAIEDNLGPMLAALTLAAVYTMNPAAAEAGFDVKATMHTVHGRTTRVSGEVRVTEEPDGRKALSGRIVIEASSLETGNGKRDHTMRTKCLAVDRFPAIVFAPEAF